MWLIVCAVFLMSIVSLQKGTVANHTEVCIQEVTNRQGNITSPAHSDSTYLECEWLFKGFQSNIKLEFLTFDLPTSEYGLCLHAYVMYGSYDHKGQKVIREKVCGRNLPKQYMTTNGAAWLTYVYTGTKTWYSHYKGFVVQYTIYMSGHTENQLYVALICGLLIPASCCLPFCLYVRKQRLREEREYREDDVIRKIQKKEELRRMLIPIKRHNWRQKAIRKKDRQKPCDPSLEDQPCKRRRLSTPAYAESLPYEEAMYVMSKAGYNLCEPAVECSPLPDSQKHQQEMMLHDGAKRRRSKDSVNTYMSSRTPENTEGCKTRRSVGSSCSHDVSASGGISHGRNSVKTLLESISELADEYSDSRHSNQSMRAVQGSKGTLAQSTSTAQSSADEENQFNFLDHKTRKTPLKGCSDATFVKTGQLTPTVLCQADNQSDLSSSTCVKKTDMLDSSTFDSSTISDPYHQKEISIALELDKNHNLLPKPNITVRRPPPRKKKPRGLHDEDSVDSCVSTEASNGTGSGDHTEENVDWSFEDQRHLSLIQECLEENDRTVSMETMMKSHGLKSGDMTSYSVDSVSKSSIGQAETSTYAASINDSVFKPLKRPSSNTTFINESVFRTPIRFTGGETFTVESNSDATYTVDNNEGIGKFEIPLTGTKGVDICQGAISNGGSSSWELTPSFAKFPHLTNKKHACVDKQESDITSDDSSSLKYLDKPPTETHYYDITDTEASPTLQRRTASRDTDKTLTLNVSTPNESELGIRHEGSLLERMYFDLSDRDMAPQKSTPYGNIVSSVHFSPSEALPAMNEIEFNNSILKQRLSSTITICRSPSSTEVARNMIPSSGACCDNSLAEMIQLDDSRKNKTGRWLYDNVFVYSPENLKLRQSSDIAPLTPENASDSQVPASRIQNSNENHDTNELPLNTNRAQLEVPHFLPGLDGSGSKIKPKIPIDCIGGVLCRVASFSSLDISMNGSHIDMRIPSKQHFSPGVNSGGNNNREVRSSREEKAAMKEIPLTPTSPNYQTSSSGSRGEKLSYNSSDFKFSSFDNRHTSNNFFSEVEDDHSNGMKGKESLNVVESRRVRKWSSQNVEVQINSDSICQTSPFKGLSPRVQTPSKSFTRSLSVQDLIQPRQPPDVDVSLIDESIGTPHYQYRRYRSTGNMGSPYPSLYTPSPRGAYRFYDFYPYNRSVQGGYEKYSGTFGDMTETAL